MSTPRIFVRPAGGGEDDWRELKDAMLKEHKPDFMHAATLGTPVLQDPNKCYVLHVDIEPSTFTFHVNLDGRKRRELLNLFYDKKTRRAERCLKQGIRLLNMWQREKEPHRKAYYWHISELKLTRALGNEPLLHFTIDKRTYKLMRDVHGNVKIYKKRQ